MARICCTLPGPDIGTNIDLMRRYAPFVSAFEIRLDLLPRGASVAGIFQELRGDRKRYARIFDGGEIEFSVIITLRRTRDGGAFDGTGEEAISILKTAIEEAALLKDAQGSDLHGSDLQGNDAPGSDLQGLVAVDIEIQSEAGNFVSWFDALRSEKGFVLIRSFHDFNGCPPDLSAKLAELARVGAVPKLAVTPRGIDDLARIAEAGREWCCSGRRAIVLGMGVYGMASRIAPEKFGSCISFASPGSALAPGQLDAGVLYREYRNPPPNEHTPLFAIVGNPVSHSKSPAFHNARFREKNLDALYIPLLCDDAAAIPRFARIMDLRGASVTVPHKEKVRSFLDEEDQGCRHTGACNTIIRDMQKDGAGFRWRGMNSDIPGFLHPLEQFLADAGENAGVCVIGAGGAGRSAVYALVSRGCTVLLLNRSIERTRRVAEEINAAFPQSVICAGLEKNSREKISEYRKLLVQTTSLGMKGSETGDPLHFYQFAGDELAYDIIYTPAETLFLGRAKQAGCRTINGEAMFVRQAEIQSGEFIAAAKKQAQGRE